MRIKLGKRLLTALVILSFLLSPAPVLAQNSPDMPEKLSAASESDVSEAQTEEVCQVTLITGDVVTVITSPDGQRSFAISPADPNKLGQHFLTIKEDGNTYIIPDGVDLQKVDRELFNIDYLVDEAYYIEPSLPLLVSYTPSLAKSRIQSLKDKISALGRKTKLHEEVNTISTRLAHKNISASYKNLMSQPELKKIWLDKKVHTRLSESVPLIGADSWWLTIGNKGEGVEIAILDTGIDSSHPALDDLDDDPATNDPKVVVNLNFTDDESFDDLFGHGTHCAGIAAGTAAGTVYQGVAPGAQLWNLKVLNQWGMGYDSWIIDGINFASVGLDGVPETGDEADIISMSLGGPPSDGTDPISQAVNLAVERGVVVVVAAGNEGFLGMSSISSPGVAEKAITVGATDKMDILADFSSIGPTIDFRVKPDILAPGVDITSSVPGGGYESHMGTSMATPHVAGAAALLQQYYGDTVSPQFIKDALMCTAKDLGYTIYEQGSGRLDLTWEPWPTVGVTPASMSMGLLTSELPPMPAPVFTFFNNDISDHDVTLTANLIDVINGVDYSGSVHLDPASFTVPASGETYVSLTIPDLASLPTSIYSGKVIATVDGSSSRTVQAIFGFAKLRQVTIHKTDINGQPAQGHPVWVLMDSPLEGEMWEEWQETDESGDFTFYAVDGTYTIVSPNWWHQENQVTIWTIAENVAISGDTTINLDEQDTLLVDFDSQKASQVVASKSSTLHCEYESDLFYRGYSWSSRLWYPSSFLIRISPISRFAASFSYSYYSELDFIPDHPELINTSEWHNLRYSVTEISTDTFFVADYNNLVHRQTDYCVALNGERAEWAQFSCDNIAWWPTGFSYFMDAPQARWEWLSPDPVIYDQWYAKSDPWGEWLFNGYTSYPAGKYQWSIGGHPLTSGVDVFIWDELNELDIYGSISRDSENNDFCNWQAEFSGDIRVTKDGAVVLEDDIWDWFYRWVPFEGTPHFTIEVWGGTPLALSPNSYTKLDFIADSVVDYKPPRIRFRVPGINLFGVTQSGEVKVMVEVTDDSTINTPNLYYSLDDGIIWNDAGLPAFESGWYVFNLGQLPENTFVSLRVDAEDVYGNHIQRVTNRAFLVGSQTVTRSITLVPEEGSIGDRITATGTDFNKSTDETDKYASLYFSSDEADTLDDIDDEVTHYKTLRTGIWLDEEGDFEYTFTVPEVLDDGDDEEDVTGGTYYVYVCHYGYPDIRAVAEFTVFTDVAPPAMEAIVEAEGQYYNKGPVFSNFGFDDNIALDDGWYQMDSYAGIWTALFSDVSVTDVSDFAVASDNTTIYAVDKESDKIYKSTNAGVSWTELLLPSDATEPQLVAVAPDDADIVAIVADGNEVYVTTNGGTNWGSLCPVQESGGASATELYDIAISPASSEVHCIAVAGVESGDLANIWYFNIGAAAPTWKETNDLEGFASATSDRAMAVAFSPNFALDKVLVAVTEEDDHSTGTDYVRFEMFSLSTKEWNTPFGADYPVTIASEENIISLTSASISLAPDYLGSDDLMRIAFVGLTIVGDAGAVARSGIYRLKDVNLMALKAGEQIHSVAYNGINLVAGSYDTNIVWRSADPLITTPTVSSSVSRPSGDNKVVVAWAGANVVAGTSGSQSAFAASTNYGETFNDISFTGTSWDSDNWTIPEFDTLAEGSHTIYFKASDNAGNVGGESGEWGWQFYKDITPPAAVTDLIASNPTSTTILLTWTAPGNDANTGTASDYDIRYSISDITEDNWGSATECTGEPTPSAFDNTETFTVSGLSGNTIYYFALKIADSAPNWSTLSNVATGTTTVAPSPAPSSGDGGGGGGGGAAGVTPILNVVTEKGRFTEDVTAKSDDRKAELYIPQNTIGLNRVSQLISSILMKVMEKEEAPATPADSEYIGSVYRLGPDGATFDPPVDLTIKYDESKIPERVAEKNLVVATFDKSTDQWVELESTVDLENDAVTAKISHFTVFTILAHTLPASFTVTDLSITPDEVDLGESISISVLITNTGDLTGSYEVSLEIDDVVAQTKVVTLDGGDSETVSFSLTPDTAEEHTVNLNGLLGICQVKVPKAPAAFTTSGLTISPAEVNIEESVTISVTVTNTGDLTGSYEVSLKIDNVVAQTKEVTLDGGGSQKLTFTITKDTAGIYTVDVDRLSGSFVVKEEVPLVIKEEKPPAPAPAPAPAPTPTPEPGINWPVIWGIIGGVAVVVGLLVFFWMRRRRVKTEPLEGGDRFQQ